MATLIETSKERLNKYLEIKGISKGQFYRDTALNRGLIDADKLHQELSSDKIATIIAVYKDIDLNWLITGNGDMIKSVIPQEHTYITHINQSKVSEKVEEVQYVPYYSFEATAGIFEQYDISEYEIGRIVVPRMPSCDGAISVTGDSMYPLIKSGDIVAFKLLNDISHIHYGDMYLVCLNEDGDTYIAIKWVKKHESDPQKAVLVSENPHHAPREVYLKDIHKIALIKFTIRYNNMG